MTAQYDAAIILNSVQSLQTTISDHRESCLLDISPPPLLASEIHVWEFPLSVSEAVYAAGSALLSEDERARAARFHFDKDARKFTIGRACMRSILAAYTRTAARDLQFEYSHYGKPSLANGSGIRFNLSHAGDRAILGLALARDVGVDIEAIRQDIECDKLAERFFSAQERQSLRSLPAEERIRGFFRCWTCKEAFLKAQGFGLTRSLASFDVDVHDGPARLLATRPDAGEAFRWHLFALEAPSGYAAAAAVDGVTSALRIFRCGSE